MSTKGTGRRVAGVAMGATLAVALAVCGGAGDAGAAQNSLAHRVKSTHVV